MKRSTIAIYVLSLALVGILFAWHADHQQLVKLHSEIAPATQINESPVFSHVDSRLASVELEIEHFQRLEDAGVSTLDALLDSFHRHIVLTQQKTKDTPAEWGTYLAKQSELHARIKQQYENGADVNIQQIAQIQEQITYIDSLKNAG